MPTFKNSAASAAEPLQPVVMDNEAGPSSSEPIFQPETRPPSPEPPAAGSIANPAKTTDVVTMMRVDQLRTHEENVKIYGATETIEDLLEGIRKRGIVDPLLITKDRRVISGHRRLRAAKELDHPEVPVRVFESDDETEILGVLLEHNRQRVKTKAQLAAEASLMMRIESEYAARRRQAGGVKDQVEKFPPGRTGKTRDVVGKHLGISGRTVEKAAKVSAAIAKLRGDGKEADAVKLEVELNKSINAGLKAAENAGWVTK